MLILALGFVSVVAALTWDQRVVTPYLRRVFRGRFPEMLLDGITSWQMGLQRLLTRFKPRVFPIYRGRPESKGWLERIYSWLGFGIIMAGFCRILEFVHSGFKMILRMCQEKAQAQTQIQSH